MYYKYIEKALRTQLFKTWIICLVVKVIGFPLHILLVNQVDSLSLLESYNNNLQGGKKMHISYLITVFTQSFNKHSLYFHYVPSAMADIEVTEIKDHCLPSKTLQSSG